MLEYKQEIGSDEFGSYWYLDVRMDSETEERRFVREQISAEFMLMFGVEGW